jgi:hypothetical protein
VPARTNSNTSSSNSNNHNRHRTAGEGLPALALRQPQLANNRKAPLARTVLQRLFDRRRPNKCHFIPMLLTALLLQWSNKAPLAIQE